MNAQTVPPVVAAPGQTDVALISSADVPPEVGPMLENGCVYMVETDGGKRQLSDTGRDCEACLSPDRTRVAFIRQSETVRTCPSTGEGMEEIPDTELWIVAATGGQARLLVEPAPSDEPKDNISFFHGLHFSPDGKIVYFHTDGWTVPTDAHFDVGRSAFDVRRLCPFGGEPAESPLRPNLVLNLVLNFVPMGAHHVSAAIGWTARIDGAHLRFVASDPGDLGASG